MVFYLHSKQTCKMYKITVGENGKLLIDEITRCCLIRLEKIMNQLINELKQLLKKNNSGNNGPINMIKGQMKKEILTNIDHAELYLDVDYKPITSQVNFIDYFILWLCLEKCF